MSRIPKNTLIDISLDSILDKYNLIFQNDNSYNAKQRYSRISIGIHFKHQPQPIVTKATVFPGSVIKEVNNELKRLEKLGLITKINYSPWSTPIGFKRKKNGDIRLYAKFDSTLNKLIDPTLPFANETVEEKINKLKHGKKFTILDMSPIYHHLRVSDYWNKYCNWNTHCGVYRINYIQLNLLPIISTIENLFYNVIKYHYKNDPILDRNCVCKNSKIIVTANSHLEHLQILEELLKRISRHYLVNREKSKFMVDSIKISNYVISNQNVTNLCAVEQNEKKKTEKSKFSSKSKQINEFIRNEIDYGHYDYDS